MGHLPFSHGETRTPKENLSAHIPGHANNRILSDVEGEIAGIGLRPGVLEEVPSGVEKSNRPDDRVILIAQLRYFGGKWWPMVEEEKD